MCRCIAIQYNSEIIIWFGGGKKVVVQLSLWTFTGYPVNFALFCYASIKAFYRITDWFMVHMSLSGDEHTGWTVITIPKVGLQGEALVCQMHILNPKVHCSLSLQDDYWLEWKIQPKYHCFVLMFVTWVQHKHKQVLFVEGLTRYLSS